MYYIKYSHLAAWLLVLVNLISCQLRPEGLCLEKLNKISADEIDTIDSDLARRIYIVNIIRYRFIDDYSTRLAIIKVTNDNETLAYQLKEDRKLGIRVSKDFIAYVKEGIGMNWGWFFVKDGRIKDTIPGIKLLIDSIQNGNVNSFIREVNGYIILRQQGKVIKRYNIGNLIANPKVNYDHLMHSLYKLQGKELKTVSCNVDDIFNQQEGLYFIPSPGYGVVKKISKRKVFDIIDSVSTSKSVPTNLEIR